MPCSASSVLLRCTSVGWAVSTGAIRGHREKSMHRVSADTGAFELGEREADAALLRRGARQQTGAPAPDVVAVFGDVGQMRKIRKRAHDRDGLFAAQFRQQRGQFLAGFGVVFAAKSHRRLADRFDHIKYEIILLLAQHIAEHPAEQADVFLERGVLLGTFWRFVSSSKIFHGDQSEKSGRAGG